MRFYPLKAGKHQEAQALLRNRPSWWHKSSFLEQGFQGQKHHSKVETCPILELFPPEFNHFPWSDPGLTA